ncbi:MAG TPA: cystathionine beta-lyase [Candidatus Binataceae bacterium]|nr:cystathionine beta-lyase [Candidatus Binataceae bacterium]
MKSNSPGDGASVLADAHGSNTRLVHGGRNPEAYHGFVNPPVFHASTVLYPTAIDQIEHRGHYHYGRWGTPTSEALENALREIEGKQCAGVVLLPSGLAAISIALLAVLKNGDHLLVSDSVYRPTRLFCDQELARWGIETTYYDPLIGTDIAALMRPNTRAVFVEAPGSLSFEMQDIPAIAGIAHRHDAVVLMDNTWATPIYFRALDKSVDLSIQSLTKYVGGHSDIMMGTISAGSSLLKQVQDTVHTMGLCVGPDDMYLALRGLRTLGVRLARHQESAFAVARWLSTRPEVLRVLHPGLESDPGYAIWKRDFGGAPGPFSVILKPLPDAALHTFVNSLKLFGKGYSWGGFESLVILFDCASFRTATKWMPGGPALRFHIGLEDVKDLISDLENAFRLASHVK